MIYEIRTYTLRAGGVAPYLKAVAEEGIAIQQPHLGTLIGYFFSDIGPLNQIVHIWAYQDLNDRTARRARLLQDPAWLAFMPRIQQHIDTMESKIVLPASFSPLQ
ncbi:MULTISPECIES: NIPSNAP family protein [Komagataeibacter]|uniref:Uncharacterized protein n=1 Tax=Komagataeibacter saccharivorans TaxID=265959 RepID=A0A347WBP6_9PROT|nr:NIPSNAP family protein [Komagataeibacter saccharivorans]AXY22289.1 hypothetical protein CD178_01512 [Komagataeibacter saccharivorans]PYD51435.1 NIPSNAP family protein [Komagataeibacter saccharivorans]QBL93780.1 hypothetical protein KSAC_15560 [Komagataeibacter saccharivorans]GBQ40349.1 hypothetical protein AA0614_1972 [Komagataeibacter saccharivorans NRIC 0614]